MSKLREKFIPHCDNVVMDKEVNSEFCEQITDDFAIKFAEFIEKYNTHHRIHKRADELLQIFKDTIYE